MPAARCLRKDSRAFMRVHRDTAQAPDNRFHNPSSFKEEKMPLVRSMRRIARESAPGPHVPPAAREDGAERRRSDGLDDTSRCGRLPPTLVHPADPSSPCACADRTLERSWDRPRSLRPRDPLALRRRLDQDPSPRMRAERRFEAGPLRDDPPFDHLPVRRDDGDLALILVNVDANMLHGWPPLRGVDRVMGMSGPVWATRGASRFIPSFLITRVTGSDRILRGLWTPRWTPEGGLTESPDPRPSRGGCGT